MSSISTQNSKALRISTVLAVVALGHLASGWLISKMKMPEIQRLEPTKPLEVKIINIEKPKPKIAPPEPKKEPPKPKEQPKPQPPKEVKIVDKPKPQITPPKPVPQRVIQTPTPSPKPQQQKAVDVPPAPPSPPVAPTVDVPKNPPSPPAPANPPSPPSPPSPPAPVQVSEGQLAWKSKPRIDPVALAPHIKKAESDTVSVSIAFTSDVKGKIVSATVTKSSGVPSLDNYVKNRVLAARLQEFKPNGVATPVKSTQNFLFHKPK